MNTFKRFIKDESGATAIEYGLLAALLSILVVGGASLAGGSIDGIFNRVATCLALGGGAGATC